MKRYVSLVLLLVTLIGCGQTSTSTIQKPSSISSTSYDSQTSIESTTTTSNASSSSIDEYYEPIEGVFTIKDFLKTNGDQFNNGYGDEIVLRGTNAGGYLVTERWMCAFAKPHYSSSETNLPESQTNYDQVRITDIFLERFGEETTQEIWQTYRDYFWTEEDFIRCSEMGINVIRLPFGYMHIDSRYHNVPSPEEGIYNFDILDNFISGAAKYGIYTILDLHGTYGSQNGMDHSGFIIDNPADVDFYDNEEKRQKTIDLWSAISNRYKDNPAVAGYDLLNEPAIKNGLTTEVQWNFYDELYKEIRKNGDEHSIIMESCWNSNNLPRPETYKWNNVVYSFHNYSGSTNLNDHARSMLNSLSDIINAKFNVPILMGEFTCYDNEDSWTYTLSEMNRLGVSWTTWTYKVNYETKKSWIYDSGWGIYYSNARLVDPVEDSLEEIKEKFSELVTIEDTHINTFESGVNTEEVIATYSSGYVPTPKDIEEIYDLDSLSKPNTFIGINEIGTFDPSKGNQFLEAEEGTLVGTAQVEYNLYSSGGRNVGYMSAGSEIKLDINVEDSCDVLISVALANSTSSKNTYPSHLGVTVCTETDYADLSNSVIESTGGWYNFKIMTMGELHLEEGENTISFIMANVNEFAFNVDYLVLTPVGDILEKETPVFDFEDQMIIQAEDCLFGGASLRNTNPYLKEDNLLVSVDPHSTIKFTIDSKEVENIAIYASMTFEQKSPTTLCNILLNGRVLNMLSITGNSGEWWLKEMQLFKLKNMDLNAGLNTIEFVFLRDAIHIDYFQLIKN